MSHETHDAGRSQGFRLQHAGEADQIVATVREERAKAKAVATAAAAAAAATAAMVVSTAGGGGGGGNAEASKPKGPECYGMFWGENDEHDNRNEQYANNGVTSVWMGKAIEGAPWKMYVHEGGCYASTGQASVWMHELFEEDEGLLVLVLVLVVTMICIA